MKSNNNFDTNFMTLILFVLDLNHIKIDKDSRRVAFSLLLTHSQPCRQLHSVTLTCCPLDKR